MYLLKLIIPSHGLHPNLGEIHHNAVPNLGLAADGFRITIPFCQATQDTTFVGGIVFGLLHVAIVTACHQLFIDVESCVGVDIDGTFVGHTTSVTAVVERTNPGGVRLVGKSAIGLRFGFYTRDKVQGHAIHIGGHLVRVSFQVHGIVFSY